MLPSLDASGKDWPCVQGAFETRCQLCGSEGCSAVWDGEIKDYGRVVARRRVVYRGQSKDTILYLRVGEGFVFELRSVSMLTTGWCRAVKVEDMAGVAIYRCSQFRV